MSFVMTGAVNEGDWWDDRDTGPFRVTDDPDDEVFYDKAWRGMHAASVLWTLLGTDRGEQITRLVQDEIKRDNNRHEAHEAYVVSPTQAARLADLMDGLEAAVRDAGLAVRDADNDWVVPNIKQFLGRAAGQPIEGIEDVTEKTRKNGKTVYLLTRALDEADRVGTFLRNMAALNRPLVYG